ncbi:kelch-like protein 3 [Dysidea avara]|uniref:kelch-like protein 3 n=1 Tax=Dysidea avara TaxID=196820 RepID=UPI003331FC15
MEKYSDLKLQTAEMGSLSLKWTQLANLPIPMYAGYVTVQDKKVYVAGGSSPVDDAKHQVYVYDINTDHWDQLPPSGHYFGIPQIIGGKLVIIGGMLSATRKMTNKVSTFDEASQTWTSYYPDLLSVRNRPGVVTHLELVIAAGGYKQAYDTVVVQDDIEVLNWNENHCWQKVSINLPVPMATFTLIVTDNHLAIVCYVDDNYELSKCAYKIPVDDITRLDDQQQTSDTPTKWIAMTDSTHRSTTPVHSSSPLIVIGGENERGASISDVKMYNDSSKSWKKIASLSSPRSSVTAGLVNNNAIIVIGGITKGGDAEDALTSCLTTVELGQAQLV